MCGIAVVVDRAGGRVDRAWLARMASTQAHRGPDQAGYATSTRGEAGLAHVRLAILDREGGLQPMRCARSSRLIIFNGEIYDHEALRRELGEAGYPFRTRSDTEVILAAYDRWGADCPAHLNGEFAFVIWDETTRTVFAARDAAGTKPLFWHEGGGRLSLASEGKAILALPWVERALSKDFLCGPFFGVYPRAVSAFEGVHCLAPGESLVAAQGQAVRTGPWGPARFAPERGGCDPAMGIEEARALVRREVTAAVERRRVADVPVHVYLSGGVDSTILCGLLARGQPELTAFHIGFDDPKLDETQRAREVAAFHGARFEVVRFGAADLAADLERTLWHTELPVGNPNSVARLALSRLARDHGAKVCLTGEGADELFGGYPYFKLEALWRRWEGASGPEARTCRDLWRRFQAMEQASKGLGWYPGSAWRRAPRTFGFASFNELRALRVRGMHRRLLRADRLALTDADDPAARFYADLDPLALRSLHPMQVSRLIADRQLAGYLIPNLGDRVEMAHGIEGRLPFLDTRLRAAVETIPPEHHLDLAHLREKRLLHEAFPDMIPPGAGPLHKHPFLAPGWSEVSQTKLGRALFEAHLSPTAIRDAGIFRALPLRVLRTVWPWLPRASNLRRQLDILLGSALGVQVLHARFVAQTIPSDPEFPLDPRG